MGVFVVVETVVSLLLFKEKLSIYLCVYIILHLFMSVLYFCQQDDSTPSNFLCYLRLDMLILQSHSR